MKARKIVFLQIGLSLLIIIVYRTNVTTYQSVTLENTRWGLKYFVIKGVRSWEFAGGQWVQFEETSFFGYDNCNQIFGEYEIIKQEKIELSIIGQTAMACRVFNSTTNEYGSIGDKEFNDAFGSVIAFKFRSDGLWLYYPGNKQNAMVFGPRPLK